MITAPPTDNPTLTTEVLLEKLAKLQAQLESLSAKLNRAEHERNEYRKLYELVFLELERTRNHLFAKKSERVAHGQLTLKDFLTEEKKPLDTTTPLESSAAANPPQASSQDSSDLAAPNGQPQKNKPKRGNKAKPKGRQILPEHLPVQRIEMPMPKEVEEHPEDFKVITQEISETLEWRRASLVRVQVVTTHWGKKKDAAFGVITSDVPAKPIEKSLAGPGLLAQVVINKYEDHLPLHRQEKIFAREKVHLARSTMCGWFSQLYPLVKRVVEAMYADALATAHCIATDATGVLLQAPDECQRGHIFVLIADMEHVIYRYAPQHNGDAVKALLGTYEGYILADAHVVYDQLYHGSDDKRKESGCWSHGRRYYCKALSTDPERSTHAISLIRELFLIERTLEGASPDVILQVRREKSKPIVDAYYEWCKKEVLWVLDESPIAKAIHYSLNQERALRRFLEDGRLRIHNNFSELQLRHQKVGMKNWLFFGNENGAHWNCAFTSLIASCRLHGIEPWAYMRDLFILLPSWPNKRILELSPKFWNKTLQDSDAQKRLEADIFRKISMAAV